MSKYSPKRKYIHRIIEDLRKGNYISEALLNAGMGNRETLRQWRIKPQKFSRYWHRRLDTLLSEAWKFSDQARVESVERGLLKRLTEGTASTGEYVFYLVNRAPQRWKHVQTVTNVAAVTVNNEKASENTEHLEEAKLLGKMGDKDLESLVEQLLEKRKAAIPAA